MLSMNGTVVTSTIAAMPIKVTADLIVAYIMLAFIVIMIVLILFVCAYRAYVKLKSYRKGPITLTPVIPFPQDDLQVFKGTDRFRNVVPDAKIQLNGKTEKPTLLLRLLRGIDDFDATLNQFMASTFKLHSRLPHEYETVRNSESNEPCYRIKPKISVPRNARTISIKMIGFKHGEKCHDFVPIGGAASESHYTYQMYGDNRIQVTKYVVDGKSEIAGFCIYIENPWLSSLEYRWTLLYQMTQYAITSTWPETTRSVSTTGNSQITERRRNVTNQQKNEVNLEENTNLISQESDDREWTVKYCSKLRRKVMTSLDSGEVVVHQEWIQKNNQMRIEKCEKCTKEGLEKEEQPPAYSSIFIA